MKTAGIVAEFNPLHNGHALLMQKIRAAGFSHIVVVMSGNYTQRGEAACLPKAARVRAALLCGADLVVELPLPWAISSAENFAAGAVSVLSSLGCVDGLCFGSECGDTALLMDCAEKVEALNDSPALSAQLSLGHSFPKARALALGGDAAQVLQNPNDTLGVEYLKALKKNGSAMLPHAFRRLGAQHDDMPHDSALYDDTSYKASEASSETPGAPTASASAIRALFSAGRFEEAYAFMPKAAAEVFSEEIASLGGTFQAEKAEALILAQLRRMRPEDFRALPDVGEGLEHRIFRAVQSACILEELFTAVKSKRYTMARIRRIVLCGFLGVDRTCTASPPPYVRVLGFNSRGTEILRLAKESATRPVMLRHADFANVDALSNRLYALECTASDLYSLCLPRVQPCATEQKFNIVRINS